LGYRNEGGTLDTPAMLFANRQSWAHVVYEAARLTKREPQRFLDAYELDAVEGRRVPRGIVY
jgi:hypothetical protein